MNMEDNILAIVDLLDSQNIEEICKGLNKLDALLLRLLPQIEGSWTPKVSRSLDETKSPFRLSSKGGNLEDGTRSPKPSEDPKIRPSTKTNGSEELKLFLKLQDNFQFNIASHLLNYYKHVQEIDDDILTCNRLLQGLLLIHPASRKLFNRDLNMKLMIGFLDDDRLFIRVTISFISTIIHILLKDLRNFRVFEANNGCSLLIRKFNLSSFDPKTSLNSSSAEGTLTQQNLNFKIIEFLIFYMIEEDMIPNEVTKSIAEKSALFRDDFPEIDSLVENLSELKDLQ